MAYSKQLNTNISMVNMPPPPPGTPAAWMPRPDAIPGVPIGLEYLSQIDQILIHQIPSLMEAFTGWEINNKYELVNSAGQRIFFAAEETDTCMRLFCGASRGFTIHILDNLNQEVIRVTREFKWCAGLSCFAECCDACAFELTVESPPGSVVGYVRQKRSFWKAHYDILNEKREPILKIGGPCCILDGACCPCDNEFKVLGSDGETQVGKISKMYAGFVREAFTTADRFGISFPLDMSVKAKATLIGALFLIDFMFFENKH